MNRPNRAQSRKSPKTISVPKEAKKYVVSKPKPEKTEKIVLRDYAKKHLGKVEFWLVEERRV